MIKENVEIKTSNKGILDFVKEYAVVAIGAMVIAFLISLIAKPGAVIGHSMDSTLHDGDYVLINKIAYKKVEPKYKDIVILNTNIDNGRILIKRVIGTPGDKVSIKNNQVYVNDQLLEEDYINEPMIGNEDLEVEVPEGKIFVMGDNRNHSLDSRYLTVGLIDYNKDIIGKVVFSLLPFKKI